MESNTFGVEGVAYVTQADDEIFRRMVQPEDFDRSRVKNTRLDISYGPLPEHMLDLYYPETLTGPVPLIFFVHGGGWTMGSRLSGAIECILTGALERGFAVASVEYRLAPGTKFPENLYDVKTAVRWARANAAQYGFDPDRFGMVGDSAGGYFTLMVAATAGIPAMEGDKYGYAGVSSAIQAAVDYYGPVEFTRPWTEYYRQSGVKCLLLNMPGTPGMDEQEFCTASAPSLSVLCEPLGYVTPSMPPVLILHGQQDAVVPVQHSRLMAERINQVCGDGRAKLLLYSERNHSDCEFLCAESSRVAAAFFAEAFDR